MRCFITGGASTNWCAARRIATPNAVLLALPISMNSSVEQYRRSLARCTIFPMSWIGWAILSAIFAAATALLAKVGVAHVDSNLAMALRTTVVLVFAWAIVFAFAPSQTGPPSGAIAPTGTTAATGLA